MLTERGTVKTSVKLDEKLYCELNKNLRTLGILYIVIGAVLTAVGVFVLGIAIYENEIVDYYDILIFVLGIVFIFIGIFFRLYYKNFNAAASKMNRIEEVEFFDGYFMEYEYTEGELTSTNKVYYKWIVKVRETKNYLFLYNTRVTAVAVDKNSLPLNEFNTVLSLLGRAPKTAPAQNIQTENAPAQNDVSPAEPFADLKQNLPESDGGKKDDNDDNVINNEE